MAGRSQSGIWSLVVSLATLVLLAYFVFGVTGKNETANHDIEKSLAGELADNNLYEASIEEYQNILRDQSLDLDIRANINYLIGKTYFDNLSDYEKAAAYFVRARSLHPDGSFYDEAGRNLITCLEKMGRMLDARRELDRSVNIDSAYAAHDGQDAVAKINDMPIFLSDVEEGLQMLPPEIQSEYYVSKDKKLEAVENYIGNELIYRAAVREGADKDPEVARLIDRITKQAVVERFIRQKVLADLQFDESDIMNYYTVNKEAKYSSKSFEEIAEQVYRDYQQDKAQQAFNDYVTKLMAVEQVQIFKEKLK
jgi:tetratricopeptide (TPR) repeat protein